MKRVIYFLFEVESSIFWFKYFVIIDSYLRFIQNISLKGFRALIDIYNQIFFIHYLSYHIFCLLHPFFSTQFGIFSKILHDFKVISLLICQTSEGDKLWNKINILFLLIFIDFFISRNFQQRLIQLIYFYSISLFIIFFIRDLFSFLRTIELTFWTFAGIDFLNPINFRASKLSQNWMTLIFKVNFM